MPIMLGCVWRNRWVQTAVATRLASEDIHGLQATQQSRLDFQIASFALSETLPVPFYMVVVLKSTSWNSWSSPTFSIPNLKLENFKYSLEDLQDIRLITNHEPGFRYSGDEQAKKFLRYYQGSRSLMNHGNIKWVVIISICNISEWKLLSNDPLLIQVCRAASSSHFARSSELPLWTSQPSKRSSKRFTWSECSICPGGS